MKSAANIAPTATSSRRSTATSRNSSACSTKSRATSAAPPRCAATSPRKPGWSTPCSPMPRDGWGKARAHRRIKNEASRPRFFARIAIQITVVIKQPIPGPRLGVSYSLLGAKRKTLLAISISAFDPDHQFWSNGAPVLLAKTCAAPSDGRQLQWDGVGAHDTPRRTSCSIRRSRRSAGGRAPEES